MTPNAKCKKTFSSNPFYCIHPMVHHPCSVLLSKRSPWELYRCLFVAREALPFLNLALLGRLHADDLVAVEQAKRVESLLDLQWAISHGARIRMRKTFTYLSHGIDGGLTKLVGKVISLDQTDSMLTLYKC